MISAVLTPRMAPRAAAPPAKAPVEWWEAGPGHTRFDTTDDLLAKFHPAAGGDEASFHRTLPPSKRFGGGLAGAAMCALVGAGMAGGVGLVMDFFLGFMTEFAGGNYTPITPFLAGAGAVAGGLFGAVAGASETQQHADGRLIEQNQAGGGATLYFMPNATYAGTPPINLRDATAQNQMEMLLARSG